MTFSYHDGDTIAATCTAAGEGGIAVIRISGPQALAVASQVFSGPVASYKTHTAHFGHVLGPDGKSIDDVVLTLFLGKRSFTGEDTVEISCHGGSLLTRRVLELILSAGARLAQPGEFSYRAFLNGKMDLAQAEAIQSLIGAKNELALDAAKQQLDGALSKKVQAFKAELSDVAGILEAWVDFPEEDLEFASMEEVCTLLESIRERMLVLLRTFHDGRIIHEGLSMALIGRPNAGKSSLMNALLGHERAIVTDIAGTTRDVLEANLRLFGLNINLLDTAGLRETEEIVEKEGIRRSQAAIRSADLVLFILDAAQGFTEADQKIYDELPIDKTLCVWNKVDLAHPPLKTFAHSVEVSAKTQTGLEALKDAIAKLIWQEGPPSKEEVLITNVRHKAALEEASLCALRVINGLRTDVSPELLAFEMRLCLRALSQIIGSNITEDVLGAIFSRFCLGK